MSDPESQPAVEEGATLLTCGDVSYTDRDIIDAALFRGELEPIWKELLSNLECENQSGEADADEGAIDSAVEKFRYDHDLITAEETEQWLETRNLTMDDFGAFFSRHYWGNQLRDTVTAEFVDYASASAELKELLRSELFLSGAFEHLAKEFAWRLAGAKQAKDQDVDVGGQKEKFLERAGITEDKLPEWLSRLGRDEAWLNEMLRLEAIYEHERVALVNPQARLRELNTLRLPLTRLSVETIELESKDAASEASLCVKVDGLSMEEVANEGRYPFRRTEMLIEDIEPALQQKFVSVTAGSLMDPIARGDGYQLWRIVEKKEPSPDDPVVQERVDKRIFDTHFSKLVSNHVQWQGPLTSI